MIRIRTSTATTAPARATGPASLPGACAAPSDAPLIVALPGVWTAAVVTLELVTPAGVHVVQLLAAAPAIACAGSGRRQCVLLGGLCALFAFVPLGADGKPDSASSRAATVLAILAVAGASYVITGRRQRLLRELAQVRAVAAAAQQVVLRPLPQRLDDLTVAGDYLSASGGAEVGGDLYEVLATPHGVRVVIGDVRGHGLAAIGTVAVLLGSFREAAQDEPELDGVLRRLDRSLLRHLREPARSGEASDDPAAEEFVTLILLEMHSDGRLVALNCGHPWPHRIDAGRGGEPWAVPLATADPLPPLGVLDADEGSLPVHRLHLPPGQALFLHTDGAEEARDTAGSFFPLPSALTGAAQAAACGSALNPGLLVDEVRAELIRHAGGRLADDVALLALVRDAVRVPAQHGPIARVAGGPGALSG